MYIILHKAIVYNQDMHTFKSAYKINIIHQHIFHCTSIGKKKIQKNKVCILNKTKEIYIVKCCFRGTFNLNTMYKITMEDNFWE